jgi:hypothetical protein
MSGKLASKLSYANVMATLAFFIAVGGGTAFAVVTANQVNSASIINGQVKKPDLAGGAVTKSKLHPNAVNGSKVLDNSLTGADVGDGSLSGADLANDSVTGTQVNESSLSGVNAATLGGLGAGVFPRQSVVGGAALGAGLRWGTALFRTFTNEDVNFGGVHLQALTPTPVSGQFKVCTNPTAIEQIPLVIDVEIGTGAADTTRTELTTSSGTPCSGTITVGVGASFRVMARQAIIFGWEGTSNNSAPVGDAFTVIGFFGG